jgi:hypothetical protein
VKERLNLPDTEIASLLNISPRTLTDWKREKFNMSLGAADLLSKKSGVKIPDKVEIRPAFWSVKKAATRGGKATIKKYGKIGNDEARRRINWRKWWETQGRFLEKFPTRQKEVHLPGKSKKLAEFVGILIGDGGISEYQVTVTLNRVTDKKYADFVQKLIMDLFRVEASKVYRQSVVNVQVSRKKLVNYLIKLGLKKGNKIKQKVDIPSWIKNKPEYALACVRGLVDTDGSFYPHRYMSKNKRYSYIKIGFTSRSEPLIKSVKRILEDSGLHPKINSRGDIRISSIEEVKSYYTIIGSSNPKNTAKLFKQI